MLTPGVYITESGSRVIVNSSGMLIEFDWVEEGGCMDCESDIDKAEELLTWSCDICGGGAAKLIRQGN